MMDANVVCPECDSNEDLRVDCTTGEIDCVACGVVVFCPEYLRAAREQQAIDWFKGVR